MRSSCGGTNVLNGQSTSATSFSVSPTSNGTFWWRVRAFNSVDAGLSAWSGCNAVTVSAPVPFKLARVSVKFVLDGNDNRPASGPYRTNSQVQAAICTCNKLLARLQADWRLQLVEIVDVPGIAQQWYGSQTNPIPCSNEARDAMQAAALANPALFHWTNDAMNIYVMTGLEENCGGLRGPPGNTANMIWINSHGLLNDDLGWIHEIGHFFYL